MKRVPMTLAVVVILLHNMIAHEHTDEMSDQEYFSAHGCAVTVLDNIVLGLHIDGGEGHLENFVTADFDFDFSFSLTDLVTLPKNECVTLTHSAYPDLPIYFKPDLQLIPLRGPPQT